MDHNHNSLPFSKVLDRIESGEQEISLWSLEPYFETEAEALVPALLGWMQVHAMRGRLESASKLLLALPERFLAPLGLGDVSIRKQEAFARDGGVPDAEDSPGRQLVLKLMGPELTGSDQA